MERSARSRGSALIPVASEAASLVASKCRCLGSHGLASLRKETTACKDGELCHVQIVACKCGVTADMVWLWMQAKHLKKEELHDLLVHVVKQFHGNVPGSGSKTGIAFGSGSGIVTGLETIFSTVFSLFVLGSFS